MNETITLSFRVFCVWQQPLNQLWNWKYTGDITSKHTKKPTKTDCMAWEVCQHFNRWSVATLLLWEHRYCGPGSLQEQTFMGRLACGCNIANMQVTLIKTLLMISAKALLVFSGIVLWYSKYHFLCVQFKWSTTTKKSQECQESIPWDLLVIKLST